MDNTRLSKYIQRGSTRLSKYNQRASSRFSKYSQRQSTRVFASQRYTDMFRIGSIRGLSTATTIGGKGHPALKYQPTYQLAPRPDGVFNKMRCEEIIMNLMISKFNNHVYNQKKSARFCCNVSEELKRRMKDEELNRYKIICNVFIGEKKLQSVKSSCRFLWDAEWDDYASYKFETPFWYAVGTVFAVYYY